MTKRTKPARRRIAPDVSTPVRVHTSELSGPVTPVRTPPLAESQREAWFADEDAITWIAEYDAGVAYELPPKAMVTVGGSRRCDITIPGRNLSKVHCLLERRTSRLRIYDQDSQNGVFFAGRKLDVADLNPGDVFKLPPMTFLALNEEMRAHRPALVEILGNNFQPTPDRMLVDAVKGSSHLLITGEPGCDQTRLARVIHAVSLRRKEPLVEVTAVPDERAKQRAIVDAASRSTLVLTVDGAALIDPTFVSMILSPSYLIRVIVIAPTTNLARKALASENVDQMQHVWIRPLSARLGEVPEILDGMLAERGAPFRLADLSRVNRDALCANEWRDNLDGLRVAADRLTAIARATDAKDWRERAATAGVARSTLHDWFMGLGLELPLFA